ncbi:MAG: DNA-binding transcriptional regulator GbsR (MarR family) [Thermoproteota archaeon]|jgi:DNA-binding transcriptional regulator GbsR (MarR family)
MKNKSLVPVELDSLCIQIGKFIEYWGFKEIEGRLWCHLLLANRPLCAQDLIDRTGVSKGLVSLSLTRLLEFDVIRLEYTQGRRTQFFQVNENVTDVIKGVLRTRERKILANIENSVNLLKSVPKEELGQINLKRLKFLQKFVKAASFYLNILIFGGEKISGLFFEKAPEVPALKETDIDGRL